MGMKGEGLVKLLQGRVCIACCPSTLTIGNCTVNQISGRAVSVFQLLELKLQGRDLALMLVIER